MRAIRRSDTLQRRATVGDATIPLTLPRTVAEILRSSDWEGFIRVAGRDALPPAYPLGGA